MDNLGNKIDTIQGWARRWRQKLLNVSDGAAFAITKWRSVSIAGPEDITIDHVVRRTCISSEDRWRKNGSAPYVAGSFP